MALKEGKENVSMDEGGESRRVLVKVDIGSIRVQPTHTVSNAFAMCNKYAIVIRSSIFG